jgi:hypothetical protein
MKNISKLYIMLVSLFVGLAACTQDFEEINTDPNNPTDVPASTLLTQAQFNLADRVWSRAMNFEFGMLMVQHFSQGEYAEDSRYNQNVSTFNASWNSFYAASIYDLIAARELVEANEGLNDAVKGNQTAVLDILKVWSMQIVTDTWVNVPYSEAFNPDEFPNPAYDDQEDVYRGLIDELNTAISNITVGEPGFNSGDIFYGGDMAAWARFANSLKLKIGMRIADVDQGTASNLVSQALNAGVFNANDEGFIFNFASDQRIANPFFVDNAINNRDDFAVSELLVETLNDLNDPRLSAFANTNIEDEYVGLPYGLSDGESFAGFSTASRPNDNIRQATAPAYLLTYAEVKFFEAEAIQRGFVSGDAEEAYNEAVTASMNQWGFDDSEGAISDYLAANPYDASNWEESIGVQKWLALYTNGLEAWSEWRRLDYPQLDVPAAAVRSYIPVRALYTSDELGNNGSAVSNSGINNEMNVAPWWDVN